MTLLRDAANKPAWKALAGYDSPEVLAILWANFIDAKVDRVQSAQLHERVAEGIRVAQEQGRSFPLTSSEYCTNWVDSKWLERRIVESTDEVYELSVDGRAALSIVDQIVSPTSAATESQIELLMSAMSKLNLDTDEDRQSKIDALEAQQERISKQIAELRQGTGKVEAIDDRAAAETLRQILAQCRQAGTDLARVRRDLIETVKSFHRKAVENEGGRGDVIEEILDQMTRLDSTDAGRSFLALYRLLADIVKVTEAEDVQDSLLNRRFAHLLSPEERIELRDMFPHLRARSSEIHGAYEAFATKLRSFVVDSQHMQERLVGQLLNETTKAYADLAVTNHARTKTDYELTLSSADISPVASWKLTDYDPTIPPPVEENTDSEQADFLDLMYLAEDTDIDLIAIRHLIAETVTEMTYATIADVVRRHGIADGLAGLAGMVTIGLHGMDEGHPAANGYDDKHEMIPWDDGRVVRVPKFIFYNRETS